MSDEDKAPLTAAVEKVRQLSMGEDIDQITAAVDELEQTAQAFSKTLYEASSADDGDDVSEDDDAIDAEFEVQEDDSDVTHEENDADKEE